MHIRKIFKNFGLRNLIPYSFRSLGLFSQNRPKPLIPEINELKKEWNQFSDGYNKFDLGPQTFYYSFLSLMNMQNAKNVLQVACGNGKLLPVAVMLKKQSTKYLAVDLAENMIERTKTNLKQNLSKYSPDLDLKEWCQKNNISLKVANAQQKIPDQEKFDRIICNCVLMLTENPQKMLQSLFDQAQKGCLLGVSVWGDKFKNNFMNAIRQSILECGFQLPNSRSNFHLYKKVGKLAQKMGWQTVLQWQQNALFPLIEFDYQNYKQLFLHQINKLPENQRQPVTKKLVEKIQNGFKRKQGLNFSCELYLFRK